MRHITTAVRRLSFAPKTKDMKVTNIETGHFVFVPRADRPAFYAELRSEVVKAGYDIEGTTIEVLGTLRDDGRLVATGTDQVFTLAGPAADELLARLPTGCRGDRPGAWDSQGERIEVSLAGRAVTGVGTRRRRSVALPLLVAAALATTATTANAAPLRTPSPAPGVYHGFALNARFTQGEERSDDRHELAEAIAAVEVRYTPATSWSVGVTLPRVERTAKAPGGREVRLAGLGDVRLAGKYRFFRQLGRWSDRQAALGFGVELPTGASRAAAGSAHLPPALRQSLQPGSGSTDLFADLSYQQARRRFVQAAALGYRRNGEGDGYRFGDEARLDLDIEAIVLPVRYDTPGHEVFALLEASLVHRQADELHGAKVSGTRRTELLLAPGLEYVATEQLALGLSAALPVVSRVEDGGLASRWQLLVEARYAF